ncbi:CDP-alcohol phosphatidyltransferase family protein [Candidatus Micrarchaeota archaeon]|nr:CDP-alcohol phosphatidyltransferase family protein [Candidatus Micrarchaeota archaeon]
MSLGLKDLATLANAVSGIAGISLAIAGMQFAWLYVFPSLFLDYLDGKLARRSSSNEFGKQLDSLADTVSFLVAPAVIIMLANRADFFLAGAGALYVAAGLMRLARFNLQREKAVYYGLPSPLAALVVLLVQVFATGFVAVALVASGIAMLVPFKTKKL